MLIIWRGRLTKLDLPESGMVHLVQVRTCDAGHWRDVVLSLEFKIRLRNSYATHTKHLPIGLFLRKPANVATTRLKIFTLLLLTVAGVVLDALGNRIVPLFHHNNTGGFLFCS
jgi:hypothetical protein